MTDSTVFYAWQSQRPQKGNRNLIEEALKKVVRDLRKEIGDDSALVLDQGARGAVGSVEISDAILKKIDHCAVFVADVTLVGTLSDGRPTPNPNVLFELGYAWNVLGPKKIVMVINRAFGNPDVLPFDISKRNMVVYDYDSETGAAPGEARKEIVDGLMANLTAMLVVDPLQVLRDDGLNDADIALFKAVFSAMMAEHTVVYDYDDLLEVGSDLGMSEEAVDDATQVIHDAGLWQASPVMGSHRYGHVLASGRGAQRQFETDGGDLGELASTIGEWLLAQDEGVISTTSVAAAVGHSELLTQHVLELLEAHDYISMDGNHVLERKPKLKRSVKT